MLGKRFRSLPIIFTNDNYTLNQSTQGALSHGTGAIDGRKGNGRL